VDAVGLAKDRVERAPHATDLRRSEERVFLPGRKNPVILKRNSTALFLLQRVRDEAHRFAITYHRQLRSKERLRSALDAIPGIGGTRRKRLLRHFGSVQRIREATVEALAEVPGISAALAAQIKTSLGEPPRVESREYPSGADDGPPSVPPPRGDQGGAIEPDS
jgi:excinuclease ABC subunit C